MSIQIVSKVKEKKVAMLTDVDVSFVSLVRHGANQQPFRVLKKEGGEAIEMKEMLVVQSLLLPTGLAVSELAKKEGLAWLAEIKTDFVKEHDGYSKLTQIPEDKVDLESIKLVKISSEGAWALVGKLAEGCVVENALTVGQDIVEKLEALMAIPMDVAVAERSIPSIVITFRQLFEREMSNFFDIVYGVMNQTGQNTGTRKKMVMSAVEALKTFLSVGLDALGKESAKMAKLAVTSVTEKTDGGGVEMFEFKSEEDFSKAVQGILDATKTAEAEASKKAADEAAAEAAKKAAKGTTTGDSASDLLKIVTEIKDSVTALNTKVEGVTKKQEELEAETTIESAASTDTEKTGKSKTETAEGEEKTSIFKGVIFGK